MSWWAGFRGLLHESVTTQNTGSIPVWFAIKFILKKQDNLNFGRRFPLDATKYLTHNLWIIDKLLPHIQSALEKKGIRTTRVFADFSLSAPVSEPCCRTGLIVAV